MRQLRNVNPRRVRTGSISRAFRNVTRNFEGDAKWVGIAAVVLFLLFGCCLLALLVAGFFYFGFSI